MSASRTSGTQMSAAKPRLMSVGYMSSNFAARSVKAALYSPEFMMILMSVERRKVAPSMLVRSVIMSSVSPSLRSNRALMLSRWRRAATPMSSAGIRNTSRTSRFVA